MSYDKPTPIKIRETSPKKNKDGYYSTAGIELVNESSIDTDEVLELLMDVADPELEVNIIDLGLVYVIKIDQEKNFKIEMTLTNPSCPFTDELIRDITTALEPVGAKSVQVEWVWVPAWTPSRVTDDGNDQLAALGMRFTQMY